MTREEWREAVRERAAIVHARRLLVPIHLSGPLIESKPDRWIGYAVPLSHPDQPGWLIEVKNARLATASELLTGEVEDA